MDGGRPRVTLKLATSLDGRIAMASGESRWITGEKARLQGHRLRAAHDAILVGVETVLADDPLLTVRLEGETPPAQPLRVVLDSRLRTPSDACIAQGNTLIVTAAEPRAVGEAEVVRVAAQDGRPAVGAVLDLLGSRGVRSVLIEGGGRVVASFIAAGAVDAVEWFRAPILLGAEGRPGVAALSFGKLSEAPRLRRLALEPLGDDLWERYERI